MAESTAKNTSDTPKVEVVSLPCALFTIRYTPKIDTLIPSMLMIENLSFRKINAKNGAKTGIVATMTDAKVGFTRVSP